MPTSTSDRLNTTQYLDLSADISTDEHGNELYLFVLYGHDMHTSVIDDEPRRMSRKVRWALSANLTWA